MYVVVFSIHIDQYVTRRGLCVSDGLTVCVVVCVDGPLHRQVLQVLVDEPTVDVRGWKGSYCCWREYD